MPTAKPRLTITMDEQMLHQIQDYQHETRCKNQTQAILDLISYGLESAGRQTKKRVPNLSKNALTLALIYDHDLDDFGRGLLRIVARHEIDRFEYIIAEQAPPSSISAEEAFADLIDSKEVDHGLDKEKDS